jgi:ATP-dependent Clp protease ATP-binding subunit ClpA
VGKSTIVGGLAQRIADREVPLENKRILVLDLLPDYGNDRDRYGLERLENVLSAGAEAIFVVDELHGPLSPQNSIYDVLKRSLGSGNVQCIRL